MELKMTANRCWIVWMLALLGLGGCASIPPEQCATMDWYALGLQDGRDGRAADRMNEHREACAEVRVVPNEQAWLEGRSKGLVEFCELPRAVSLGRQRSAYEGVCTDARFGQLYRAARKVGDAQARVDSIDSDISWRESEIDRKKTSDDRRRVLRSEIRDLDRQRSRARDDRDDAEDALERLRRDLGV